MDRLDMVLVAIRELGDASSEALAGFVAERFGVQIVPKFIPIYKASLRDRQQLAAIRAARPPAAQPDPPAT